VKRFFWWVTIGVIVGLLLLTLTSSSEKSKDLEGIFKYRFGMSPSEAQIVADGILERSSEPSTIPGLVEYSTDQGHLFNRSGNINVPAGLCLSFYKNKLTGIIVEFPEQEDMGLAMKIVAELRSDTLGYYDESLVCRDEFYPNDKLAVITLRDSDGDGLLLMWDGLTIFLCSMTGELLKLDPECEEFFE